MVCQHVSQDAEFWGSAWVSTGQEPPGGAITLPAVAVKGCLGREQVGNWWGWFPPAEVCTDLSEGWGHGGVGDWFHP